MKTSFIILALCSFLSASASGELVSTVDKPLKLDGKPEAIGRPVSNLFYSSQASSDGSEFISFLGGMMADSYEGSFFLAAEKSSRFNTSARHQNGVVWSQALRLYTGWGAKCEITTDKGFAQIVFGTFPETLIHDEIAAGRLPPFVIAARNAGEAIAVCQAVTGWEFLYDPETIHKEVERQERAMEAFEELVERKKLLGTFSADDMTAPRTVIQFEEGATGEQIMGRLAGLVGCAAVRKDADKWEIAPKMIDDTQLNQLMSDLLHDQYDHGYGDTADALVRIGEAATGALIAKLTKENLVAEPYYYNSITRVLARIPSRARDEAFFAELTRESRAPSSFLYHWYGTSMVQALAESGYQPAIPLFQELARDPGSEVGAAARVALGRMGSLPEPRPLNELLEFASDEQLSAIQSEFADELKAIHAVVDSVYQPYGVPLIVSSFSKEGKAVVATGPLRNREGKWSIRVVRRGKGRFVVEGRDYCGNLCGAGYEGKVESQGEAWIVTEWSQTWVS